MRPPTLRLVLLACIALLVASCDGAASGPERIDVTVGDVTFDAEVARTPEERSLGLGERDELRRGAAMLFVLDSEYQPTFGMNGMRFALDFVWIASDRTVSEVTLDVPPPTPDVEDSNVNLSPDEPVRWVLEVNAGVVEETGIAAGDRVRFEPEP